MNMLIAYGNVESVEIPSKPGEIVNPGQVWRKPVYRPGGGRHELYTGVCTERGNPRADAKGVYQAEEP